MNGAEMIAAERARQINQEGWDAGHDDEHGGGELAYAAVTYTLAALCDLRTPWPLTGPQRYYDFWPWDESWLKPTSPLRDLVKAGALIAAEIDRLQRAVFGLIPEDGAS
jgi:hypothetical protein